VGGLGVGGEEITGMGVAGLGIGAERITGFHVAGVGLGGEDLHGFFATAGLVKATAPGNLGTLHGVGIGAVNYVNGRQTGLTIGIVNVARSLNGVQIGLVNYAGNNPSGLKVLPLVNAHFD